jgi:predicted transcriptional regulator
MKPRPSSSDQASEGSTKRLSISVSEEEKVALEKIATAKRVSLAWVVRDAISKYLVTEKGR